MAQWFSFVRSEDDATASISINIGITAERDVPARPLSFLLVRKIEDGADPAPIRDLENQLNERFEAEGIQLVAVMTMSGSRTLVLYGDNEARLREIMAEVPTPFAIQASEDRAWQLYRTLLPTNEEINANG